MRTTGAREVRGAGRGRPGFTLLEMILVISTILFLLGFLIAMAGSAHGDAKKRATESLVQAIETATVTYYNQWGDYPPMLASGNNMSQAPSLYHYLVDAKYGGCMPQVPQGALNYTPGWNNSAVERFFADTWAAAPARNTGPGGDYWIGQIFYVAFAKKGLQSLPANASSADKEQQKMWGICGGVPLIWSLGPDTMGYDGDYIRKLTTAQALQTLLYDTTGVNADNIHNFRDIPMDLVQ